jgi:hypothetical protein
MGRLDDALRECRKAIEVDPEFGNPYNDIGAICCSRGRSTRRFHGSVWRWKPRDMKATAFHHVNLDGL